jgi:hypothetical protein
MAAPTNGRRGSCKTTRAFPTLPSDGMVACSRFESVGRLAYGGLLEVNLRDGRYLETCRSRFPTLLPQSPFDGPH